MAAQVTNSTHQADNVEISLRRAILKGLLLGSLAMIAAHVALFAFALSGPDLVEINVLSVVYPVSILAVGSLFAALMIQKYISYFFWIPRTTFFVIFGISLLTGVLFAGLAEQYPPSLVSGALVWVVANYFAIKLLMTEPVSHDEKAGLVQPMAAVQMNFILAFMIAATGLKGVSWVIMATELGAILMFLAACYGINGRLPEHRKKRFIFNMFILPTVIISFAVISILGELQK